MVEVREITQGQTAQVAEALLVLRPRWKTADAVLNHMLSEVGDEGLRLSEVKTLDQAVDYAPYVATRAFWERRGFIQIDAIDPMPGWLPGKSRSDLRCRSRPDQMTARSAAIRRRHQSSNQGWHDRLACGPGLSCVGEPVGRGAGFR